MILKEADSKQPQIDVLNHLISIAPSNIKPKIERELKMLLAGIKGESEAAYHLDFHFKASKNTIVIHDLRLVYDDRVAQIDHLVIHRTLNIYVLETKHFNSGFKISDNGEFLQWNNYLKKFEGMASPIAQNERHIAVLKDLFNDVIEVPTRLGIKLQPIFHSRILVNPKARVDRSPVFDSKSVVKVDLFFDAIKKDMDNKGVFELLAKASSREEVLHFSKHLINQHKPVSVDYAAKFSLKAVLKEKTALPTIKKVLSSKSTVTHQVKQELAPYQAYQCGKCSSTNIKVEYGKFGYYFKCTDCDGNTSIKINCGKDDGHKARLRKERNKFYQECVECETSTLFFEN